MTIISVDLFFTEILPPQSFYNSKLEKINIEDFNMYSELKSEADSLGIEFNYYLYSDSIFDNLDEKIETYRHILPQKLQNDSLYNLCNTYDIHRRLFRAQMSGMQIDPIIYKYNSAVSNYIRLYEMVNDKKRQNSEQSEKENK